MNLEAKIQKDLIDSIKAKDETKKQTLRMLKAVIEKHKMDKRIDDAEDEVVQSMIQKQVKQRQESYEIFKKAGRDEMAEKEKSEMAILETYLPKQLSDEELEVFVKEALTEAGAKSKADMGKVMKLIMPKVKGRAEGKRINALILKCLT